MADDLTNIPQDSLQHRHLKWFRWYEGTCGDGKFQVIARNADVTVATVIGVWAMLLEDASHLDHRGIAIKGVKFYSTMLDLADSELDKIIKGMADLNMILIGDGMYISNWNKRQFESDAKDPTNAERQKRWREKHRHNAAVTASNGPYRPDTDTDTDTDTDKKEIAVAPPSAPLTVKQNGTKKDRQPRKGVKTRISDDWKPSQSSISDAIALGFTEGEVTREAQKFRNHARQNERMVIRWDSAFDNWMIKAAEYANKRPPEPPGVFYPALPGSPEFQAWRTFWMDSGNPMVMELKQREIEGRAFKFESKWPPGFGP